MWGDAVASVLVDRLCSFLQSKACQFSECEHQFQELKAELCYIQSFLEDANNVKPKQQCKTLKTTMADLRELAYDAEEIIEDYQQQFDKVDSWKIRKLSVGSFASSLNPFNQMGKRLETVTQGMKKVREQMTGYLVPVLGLRSHNQSTVQNQLRYPLLLDEDEIVGMDIHSGKIKQWMLDRNGPLTVIGIVGMGGIGKTTLAEKIYHDAQHYFRIKLFVTVSRSFNFSELLKTILVKLNVEEAYLRGDTRDLLEKLQCKLDREYLIVLDDVWGTNEGMWWESLKSGLPKAHHSCVIVTTRNEEVAKSMGAVEEHIHQPNLLSDDESWSLFSKVAFQRHGGDCPNSCLEDIGRKIVLKCGRLPLAIKITGGMMVTKGDSIHKWQQTWEQIEQTATSIRQDALLIKTLELSYEDLPAHLQPCVLCFAMYPEDYVYKFLDMVYWWIGEGFVWERDGRTALEIGEEYYVELLSRCLIIGEEKDTLGEKFVSCRMHDIVHEMIKKIAVEENFMDRRYRDRNVCSTTHAANFEEFAVNEIPEADTLMKQRTLSTWVDLDDRFLRCLLGAPRLRVLELTTTWMLTSHQRHWVQGIGTLRNLTYMRLDFQNQAELPDSFEGLHNLKVLVIKSSLLLKLPPSIATLEKLVILDVDAPRLENMPHGLGRLSNLEKLLRYRPPDGSFNEDSCWELEKLSKLRELEVFVSPSDEMEEEALKVLAELPVLKVLRVRIRGAPVSGQRSARITRFYDEMVRRVGSLQLRPLQRLEELHILYYPGESVPAWLNSTIFPNLRLVYFEVDWILRITSPGMTALMTRIGLAIPHARIKFGDESTP